MTKFQIGDTVRLVDQSAYGAVWGGDMTVTDICFGEQNLVEALHPDHKQTGAFDGYELELVYREDNEAPTGGVILWIAVALLIWAVIVGVIGYQAVMS